MTGPELVLVPALVGLDAARAHEVAMGAGVVVVGPDPEMPPVMSGVVVRQDPTPGTRVPPGEPILVWIDPGTDDGGDGGGGGGLPGPRSPQPVEPSGVKEPA